MNKNLNTHTKLLVIYKLTGTINKHIWEQMDSEIIGLVSKQLLNQLQPRNRISTQIYNWLVDKYHI